MASEARLSAERLATGVRAGDRRALSRAITLVESSRADHRADAERLLALLDAQPRDERATAERVGVTGAPGVGKSTFIDAFGACAVERGLKVAVLGIDPSSSVGGGSILGDKTRMRRLSAHERAFVRPSPSGGASGGVAYATPEVISLCEAAGYDLVVVETVGVGQTEHAVRELVDVVLLLVQPGAGDEIQGIKRGILEVVDCVVVNKADGELAALAETACSEYGGALRVLRGDDAPEVLSASALEGSGIEQVWEIVRGQWLKLEQSGALSERRRAQEQALFWRLLEIALLRRFMERPETKRQSTPLLERLAAGELTAPQAVRRLLAAFTDRSP